MPLVDDKTDWWNQRGEALRIMRGLVSAWDDASDEDLVERFIPIVHQTRAFLAREDDEDDPIDGLLNREVTNAPTN